MPLERVLRRKESAAGGADPLYEVCIMDADGSVLLTVQLPNLPPTQRRSAARFALEDTLLAVPEPDEVFMGPEFPAGSGRWLVMVVSAEQKLQIAQSKVPVFSELMLVDVPAQGWNAVVRADGVLLRGADGSGMVLPPEAFAAWSSAAAASGIVTTVAPAVSAVGRSLATTPGAFDLRRKGREDFGYMLERGALWATAPVFVCLLVLWAVAAIQTDRIRADRDQALSDLGAKLQALGSPTANPLGEASAIIALAAEREEGNAVFQSLLSEMSAVPFASLNVFVRSLRFSRAEGTLVLGLGAPTLQELQAVEDLFSSSVAKAALGPTELRDGMAVADLTLGLQGSL